MINESSLERVNPAELLDQISLPSDWEPMNVNQEYGFYDLKCDNPIYIKLKDDFLKSLNLPCKILSITRIQNPDLYIHFKSQENKLKRRFKNAPNNQYKYELYHGTKKENVNNIARYNFDWRLAGANVEALYGDGVYFSNSANYSNNYADKAPETNECYMFIASVLVGDYAKGERGLKRPPVKSVSQLSENNYYDSCVDDVNQPTIFVLFDFNHIYPDYLIKYSIES